MCGFMCHRDLRKTLGLLLYHCLLYSFETRSLTESEARLLPASPSKLLVPAPYSTKVTDVWLPSRFLHGCPGFELKSLCSCNSAHTPWVISPTLVFALLSITSGWRYTQWPFQVTRLPEASLPARRLDTSGPNPNSHTSRQVRCHACSQSVEFVLYADLSTTCLSYVWSPDLSPRG